MSHLDPRKASFGIPPLRRWRQASKKSLKIYAALAFPKAIDDGFDLHAWLAGPGVSVVGIAWFIWLLRCATAVWLLLIFYKA